MTENQNISSRNREPEESQYASLLFHLLFDHCKRQMQSGVSAEEILQFVNTPDLVRNFYKEHGHDHVHSLEDSGANDCDNVSRSAGMSRDYWKISKILRCLLYTFMFAVSVLICHVGICHLVDENPLKFVPLLQEKRCLLPAHPILMEITRPIADCGFCSSGESIIETMEVPSKLEFAEVAYLSKPIIIRSGGIKGGMPEGFDFHKLKDIFQSEPGGVDAVSEECQFLPFRSPFITLKEAFDRISENSSWEEPWYIGWSNCHPGVAAKLRELFPRPEFLPEDSSSSAIDWIFIGSPGLGASMHIDYVKRPSWQAQLAGIKRWILHPPPECESVCPETLTFTINPGDLLFLETNTWYHETFIDSDSLSISIGSEYD